MTKTETILYTAIVHGKASILAEVDLVAGVSRQLALAVLDRIEPEEHRKVSYVHEDKSVHYVTAAGDDRAPGGVTYIVVSKGDVQRRVAFVYLHRLEQMFKERVFTDSVGDVEDVKSNNALQPQMRQLVKSAENGEFDQAGQAQQEIEQVKNIMVDNVERVLERNERINLLVSKTDRMSTNSLAFRRRTVQVRRNMWWKNIKLTVLMVVVLGLVIYLTMGYVCGLPAFEHCFS